MRNDKAKNTAKILSEVIKNPLSTEREIAERTGLSKTTAHNLKGELDQIGPKSDLILEICDLDINLVKKGLKELDRRFSDIEELKNIRAKEISDIARDSAGRYTIFKGSITDPEGGMKFTSRELELLKIDQLNDFVKSKLN